MNDEEMAFKLVELYVHEISQRGEKRQMGLDTILNAYFYTLTRLKNKMKELETAEQMLEKREKKYEVEQISFPGDDKEEDEDNQFALF